MAHPRRGEQPSPPGHRPHRPLPGAPARRGHRHRRDPVRPVRSRTGGQGARDRPLHLPGGADRRGPVDGRAARSHPVPHRATAVLHPGPGRRGRRAADRPALRPGCADLGPAQRGLALRQVRQADGHQPHGGERPGGPRAAQVRSVGARQRPQAGGPRRTDEAGRRGRPEAPAPGDRVRTRPPGRHLGDHRPADERAPGGPAGERERRVEHGRPGPDRRDRASGHGPEQERLLLHAPALIEASRRRR